MILYRPTGLKELELIAQNGYREFPPRLPEQPFFYPVLVLEYARQITREWNTKSAEYVGFVTRFEVDDKFVTKYPVPHRALANIKNYGYQQRSFKSLTSIF